MQTIHNNGSPAGGFSPKRREFLKQGIFPGAVAILPGAGFLTGCKEEAEEEGRYRKTTWNL